MENTTAAEHYCEGDTTRNNVGWITIDTVITLLTLAGNTLTISAIILSKKISEVISNRYIFSLAVSDFMVGLTTPYHLAFTIGDTLGRYRTTCLLRFVLIILACSSSIYNLLAIAADRYIAIVLPFHYYRYINRRIVWSIVCGGWLLSFVIASVPIYWNQWETARKCTLNSILPTSYIYFILIPMFLSIWLVMLLLYIRIYREAAIQEKRIRAAPICHQKRMKPLRENKSVQMVLTILGCFSICWLPYFSVMIYLYYDPGADVTLMYELTFSLAMANSCLNPAIYAWKNQHYRDAFNCMLKCRSPKILAQEPNYITDHVPSAHRIGQQQQSMEIICIDDKSGEVCDNISNGTQETGTSVPTCFM